MPDFSPLKPRRTRLVDSARMEESASQAKTHPSTNKVVVSGEAERTFLYI